LIHAARPSGRSRARQQDQPRVGRAVVTALREIPLAPAPSNLLLMAARR